MKRSAVFAAEKQGGTARRAFKAPASLHRKTLSKTTRSSMLSVKRRWTRGLLWVYGIDAVG